MRSVVSILLCILLQATATSQPCLPEGITFSTQAQIDSFQINYPNCTEIAGDIAIQDDWSTMGNITNLNGLNALTSIGGNVLIEDNDSLASLSGLDGISYIGGNLVIYGNHNLDNLTGFNGLNYIEGNLHINWNTNLTSLTGLESIDSVGMDLSIENNYMLLSLSPITNISSVGRSISVFENYCLENLFGLENINSIHQDITIQGNSSLVSLTGLDNINTIGGNLTIYSNTALSSLAGLENIDSIGGSLSINNTAVVTLSELENLTHIGGKLSIIDNTFLINVSDLLNLSSIGGMLSIRHNPLLSSLSGLENIEANSISDLMIWLNNELSDCAVQSICDYLADTNGFTHINYNKYGCNSVEEVEEACESVSLRDMNMIINYQLSPNPFTTSTTLTYTLDKPSPVTIGIFNPQGQLIEIIEQEQPKGEQEVQWNAEGLPAGVYYFRIQAGDKVGGGKMVKME